MPQCLDLCEILRMENEDDKIAELNKIEQGFARITGATMRGCVGAGDGLAIEIRRPRRGDDTLGQVPNPASYRNRKGFFALNMQGFCDAQGYMRNISLIYPGSTHDSAAYVGSDLGILVSQGKLPMHYWFVLDDAYSCTEQAITPYPGRGLDDRKGRFQLLSVQHENQNRMLLWSSCCKMGHIVAGN